MASLDSLPADQKAVLSLVLQRGRSFDEIAAMLSINRAAVRQRALEGFDALGPDTALEPLKRALITDYLLGQLPSGVATSVRNSLAANPPERAWARIIAAEIGPLAATPLPEIPSAGAKALSPAAAPAPVLEPEIELESTLGAGAAGGTPQGAGTRHDATGGASGSTFASDESYAPRSSRRGGAILLGLIALVIVVVVVVLLVTGGSSKKKSAATTTPATTSAQAPSTATTPATGTGTAATPLHQINMTSPTSVKGREGAADVVKASGKLGIVLVAEGLVGNAVSGPHRDAYGVWLYDSKSGTSKFLGFYGQQVASTGKTKGELEAEVKLPAGATSYNELLLTLETAETPTTPGPIVLEGTFAE